MTSSILLREERSGLTARAALLPDKAPAACAFMADYLAPGRRAIPAIHAMWTGPEISCPIPDGEVPADWRDRGLPLENGTLMPAAGDVVLAYVPPRAWGGEPYPTFDIGLFYGAGGRLLLPIGWVAASLFARIRPEDLAAAQAACAAIRRTGACTVTIEGVPE